MKNMYNVATKFGLLILITIMSGLVAPTAKAEHIIGGELTYEYQGNDFYLIRMKIFRDCACINCANFDNPAFTFIYDDQGNMVYLLEMQYPGPEAIPFDLTVNPCLELPPGLCVEQAVYEDLVYLPPITGGYHVVHQRCCRNNTILNITLPNTKGLTLYAHIPDTAVADSNSSPYFTDFPPIALCINDSVVFDHSATDPDGDSLVYELCAPFNGASQNNPKPDPGTPPPPPPYDTVTYEPGYSFDAPLNGNPQMQIDSATGIMTCSPTTIGQFIVGVCVTEYRDGVMLSQNKRDFQFNVVGCNQLVTAALPSYVLNCDDSVNFLNNTINGTLYQWDFGDSSAIDSSETPLHVYADTGVYDVTLIVNAGWSCSDTATMQVNVLPDLASEFATEIHCADSDIVFMDLSSNAVGSITDWSWSFGDGFSSTNASPTHNYLQGGTYNVYLSVTNDTGCVDTKSELIYVYEEPPAAIYYNSICADSLITFNDDTQLDSGSVVSWSWDIGGFVTGTDSIITYTFDDPGFYQLTLDVVTNHGCTGFIAQTINVDSCFVIKTPDLLDGLSPMIRVIPNPSNGLFTISNLDQYDNDVKIEVYEISGKLLLKSSKAEILGTNSIIDLRAYGEGIFLMRLSDRNATYSVKLVVH